jgi:hypothetical protein
MRPGVGSRTREQNVRESRVRGTEGHVGTTGTSVAAGVPHGDRRAAAGSPS